MKAEVAKSDVLCTNCYTVKTRNQVTGKGEIAF